VTLLDVGDRPSLAADASTEKDRFLLTVLTGPAKGSVFKLNKEIVSIGRSEDADVALPDPSLSRIHARFLRAGRGAGSGYLIEDCDSTNGTFVAGERVHKPTPLEDGVRLGLGKRTLARFARQDELEEQAIVSVHESALRDPLTRAYNRRVFDDRLKGELAFSVRHSQPLTLLLMDVDHFKKFNDTHGHQAGDLVLQVVAQRVADSLRTEDLFARYGGEEFVVLARDTSPLGAMVVGERIRALIERSPIEWEGQKLHVTVSIGMACNEATPEEPEVLLRHADEALYKAKDKGRNCVVIYAE
jgi:diguanylate cyclase (GGDEF)-like protein